MAPPPAQGGAARRAAAAPQTRPSTRRPPLRVLEPRPRRSSRRGLSRRGHVWLAVAMVVGALLMVVVGDAMVAQGQVRLAGLQTTIDGQAVIQKAAQTQVAELAAPDRVVAEAISQGLTAPPTVSDLPQVPLNVPLPVPDTSPLPAPSKPAAPVTTAPVPPPAATTTSSTAPPTK